MEKRLFNIYSGVMIFAAIVMMVIAPILNIEFGNPVGDPCMICGAFVGIVTCIANIEIMRLYDEKEET